MDVLTVVESVAEDNRVRVHCALHQPALESLLKPHRQVQGRPATKHRDDGARVGHCSTIVVKRPVPRIEPVVQERLAWQLDAAAVAAAKEQAMVKKLDETTKLLKSLESKPHMNLNRKST